MKTFIPKKQFLFLLTVIGIATMAGLLFGFDTGIISGAILFLQPEFGLDNSMIEMVVSSALLGALLGAIMSGRLVNFFGRRFILKADAILFLIGTLFTTFAPTVNLLILGRVIVGFGIGIASYIAPLYISELSPARYRGGLIALNTIAVTGGIVVSYLVSFLLSPYEAWNWMFGIGIIPAVLLWIGTHFLPESPRWMVKQGNLAEAKKLLLSIRSDEKEVEEELQAIQANLKKESPHLRELTHPNVRKLVIVGIALAVIQQVTGINVILYYAPLLFKTFGFESTPSNLLLTLGIGLINFLMTFVVMVRIDRAGRKALLLKGLAGMTISLSLLAICLNLDLQTVWVKWSVILSIFTFIATYAGSIGCIFWIVIAEIYPLNIRATAMGIASSANWAANLLVNFSFLSLIEGIGLSPTFFCYAACGLLSWLFCFRYLKETSQASLEEIEEKTYGEG